MHQVLQDLGQTIHLFLAKLLPVCDANWWENCVIAKLTFQQQRLLEERSIKNLSELDLAALLRIVDQNWFDINQIQRMQSESRNWLKESQSIRNRWAHLPPGGLSPEDQYRDLDTVVRLLETLGADEDLVARTKTSRDKVLQMKQTARSVSESTTEAVSDHPFAKGRIVRLKARPELTGVITEIIDGGAERRYQVFHDGAITSYFQTQIEIADTKPKQRVVDPETLHASLTSLQIRHPSTSHLFSLYSSRINLVPYQFRPVLKLIQSDRPRILIADEVGVGKTIEAGLILKELQARSEIKSVLVICPKPLVAERKWQEEMKRFDEQFTHIDGNALRYCIEETHLDGAWPQQYARSIIPYSLFDEATLMGRQMGNRRQQGLLDLDPPPSFDLVIVDEAHHIRNTDTWAYRSVRHFCENAEAVVLLSATPIQLKGTDLYNLLHILRPDILYTVKDFERMAQPNPHINKAIEFARIALPDWQERALAEVHQALGTEWGQGVLRYDSRTQEALDILEENDTDRSRRIDLIGKLENLYTFSPLVNRTRRRDIGRFTTRKPETVEVALTEEQSQLHDSLIRLIERMLEHRRGDLNLKFMTTTLRRQLSSCVFGLAPFLETILNRHISLIELYEAGGEELSEVTSETLNEFRTDVDEIIRKARLLNGRDPKFDAFLKVIQDKQKLENNKLIVFSTFRHTLAYLIRRLSAETVRIGLIQGDVSDDERRDLRNRFSLSKESPQAIDILLSSEVGCEGLDYQFCDGMVNYDLPWNPMRIEQRIGRIDRYGQKSDTVVIYNFITPNTVDAAIYKRCLLRIGVFQQALGGSEEILGRLTQEIRDIAENLELTEEEREIRLQQLADNEIRALQVQAELEEAESKFFGLQATRRDDEMIKDASSFWLSPARLANLVERYLEAIDPGKPKRELARKSIVTLQLGHEFRNKLLADFQRLGQKGNLAQCWDRWLKGSDPNLTLTFNPQTADERRDIVFITPMHPLARQAAQHVEPTTPLVSYLRAKSEDLPSGRYPFAIYRWSKIGMKDDFTFQPVALNPELSPIILPLLEYSAQDEADATITHDEERALEHAHYLVWLNERANHIEKVQRAANARKHSLDTSHAGRMAVLEEQRDIATDSRIRRMRESQILSATRDYERRVAELIKVAERGDIIGEAVAFGVINVESRG